MLSTSINDFGSLEQQIGLRMGEAVEDLTMVDDNVVSALLRGVAREKRATASSAEELAVKILVKQITPGLLAGAPSEPEELGGYIRQVVYETFNSSPRTMGQRVAQHGSASAYAVISACTNAIRMHAVSEPDDAAESRVHVTLNSPAFVAAYAEAAEKSGARTTAFEVEGQNHHTQLISLAFSRMMSMRGSGSPTYSTATDPAFLFRKLSGSDVKTISVVDSVSVPGKPPVTLTQSVTASVMIGKVDRQMLDSVPARAITAAVDYVRTHQYTNGGPDRWERLLIRPGAAEDAYVSAVTAFAAAQRMMDEAAVRDVYPANSVGWVAMMDAARAFHPLASASRGLPAVWPSSYCKGKPNPAQVDKYHEQAAYRALGDAILGVTGGTLKPENFGLDVYRNLINVNPVLLASILKAKTDVYAGKWEPRKETSDKGAVVEGAVFETSKAPRLYYVSSYAVRIVHAVFQSALSAGVRGLHLSSIRRDREGVDDTPFGPRLAAADPRRDSTRSGYFAGRPVFKIEDVGRVAHCHKLGLTLGGAHLLMTHARRMVKQHGYQVYAGGDDTLVFFSARDRLFTVSLDAARFDRTQNQKWAALDQAVYIRPLLNSGTPTNVALSSLGQQVFSRMLSPRLSLVYKSLAVRTEGALSGSTCLTEHNGLLAGSVVGYQFSQHVLDIAARLEAVDLPDSSPESLALLLPVLTAAVDEFVLKPIASRGGLKFEIEAVDCLFNDEELEERIAYRRDPANQASVPGGHTKFWVCPIGVGQSCFLGREFILAMDEVEAVGYAAPLLAPRYYKMLLDKPVRALDEDADEDVEPNGVAKALSFLLEGAIFYSDWSQTCYDALAKYGGLLTAKSTTPELTAAFDVDWSVSGAGAVVAVFPDPGGIASFHLRRRTKVPMREGATTRTAPSADALLSVGVTPADLSEFADLGDLSGGDGDGYAPLRAPPPLPPAPVLRRPPPAASTVEPPVVSAPLPPMAEVRQQAAAARATLGRLPELPRVPGLLSGGARRLTREVVVSSQGPERRMAVPLATFDEVDTEREVIAPRAVFDVVAAARTGRAPVGAALTAQNRLIAGLTNTSDEHPDVFRLHMALVALARDMSSSLIRSPAPHRVVPVQLMWKAMELAGLQGGVQYMRELDAEARAKRIIVAGKHPSMMAIAEPFTNRRTGLLENATYSADGQRVVALPWTEDHILNGLLYEVEERALSRMSLDRRAVPTTTIKVVDEQAPVFGSGATRGAGGTTAITVRPPLAPMPRAAPRLRAQRVGGRQARGAGAPDFDAASDLAGSEDGFDHDEFLALMRGGADSPSIESEASIEDVPWG